MSAIGQTRKSARFTGMSVLAMPTLTGRRPNDAHAESWQIFYGDVQVGAIGIRGGVPADVDQWGWNCRIAPPPTSPSIDGSAIGPPGNIRRGMPA
jgi:hypothetical protein